MEEKREEGKKKGAPHSPAGPKHVAIVGKTADRTPTETERVATRAHKIEISIQGIKSMISL